MLFADDVFCVAWLPAMAVPMAPWFLLGVEHTIVFCIDDIIVDALLFDVFRSGLLARTAVGFTGCKNEKSQKNKTSN